MGKSKGDLTGRRFGRLYVVGLDEERTKAGKAIYWTCLCDCTNVVSVATSNLFPGKVRSCGCLKTGPEHTYRGIDYTGKKHGDGIVECLSEERNKSGHVLWKVKCGACGKYYYLSSANIRFGYNPTCCQKKKRVVKTPPPDYPATFIKEFGDLAGKVGLENPGQLGKDPLSYFKMFLKENELQVLTLRYINGLNYSGVGKEIGGKTREYARKLTQRALMKCLTKMRESSKELG